MGEEEQRQAGREREGSVHTLASLSRTSMSTPGPGSASLNPKSIRFLKMKLCLHTAVVLGAFSVFSLLSHSLFPVLPSPFHSSLKQKLAETSTLPSFTKQGCWPLHPTNTGTWGALSLGFSRPSLLHLPAGKPF